MIVLVLVRVIVVMLMRMIVLGAGMPVVMSVARTAATVVMVVIVVVAVQQVRSPQQDGSQQDDDGCRDDVGEIACRFRQTCGNAPKKKADGETADSGADDECGCQAEDPFAAFVSGNEWGQHDPGMSAGVDAVNESEEEAGLHGNPKE
ncbi:conserved protein of unknown function [Pseudodesulfovibrio profundus]|uniref:Uncharacterized protein n=1 Tax=Pseudodesulfovibrio profundus TaxID=57320 RepID=A0A2C8FBM6_9BACT|nr:conserved protein of unknown function [Pseudodesulfovibrio profundus]